MPELLVRICGGCHANHPSQRSVVLTVHLARHTAIDWDNTALLNETRSLAALSSKAPRVAPAYVHTSDQIGQE